MVEHRSAYRQLVIGLVLAFGLAACSNDDPAVIYDPDQEGAPTPAVTAVDPPDEAVGGVSVVTISGNNFSPLLAENFVYFDNQKAELLSGNETQLEVVPPTLLGDAITISVVVQDALAPGFYDRPYKLQVAHEPYGNLTRVRSVAMDADENLYVAPPNGVIKVPLSQIGSEYGDLTFTTASRMRFGPEGYLYAQRRRNIRLYRIPPGGGETEEFARWPERAVAFDFSESGHIYGGGDGLMVMNPDGSDSRLLSSYQNVQAVRVFDGAVYVGLSGSEPGVWRNVIQDDQGNVGPDELVLDWTTVDSAFAATDITDITFSADGSLFIAAGDKDLDPILVLDTDGNVEPLFPGVLTFPVANFVWGNGVFLYANHDLPSGVSRINTGELGAPHYGRR
jgi:hypothetical protein